MGMKPALIVESSGPAPPLVPPTITSQRACWWATDLALANNDPVSSWVDRVNSFAATQTLTARPTYLASGIGGRPSVDFESASSQYLRYAAANAASTAAQGVIVVVVQYETLASGDIWSSSDEAVTTRFIHHTPVGAGQDHLGISQRNSDTSDILRGDTALSTGVPYILEWASSGTAYSLRVNNVSQTLTIDSGANNGDWFGDTVNRDNFVLGGWLRTTLVNTFDGMEAFVLIADAELSAGDRTALYAFLSEYYGIVI